MILIILKQSSLSLKIILIPIPASKTKYKASTSTKKSSGADYSFSFSQKSAKSINAKPPVQPGSHASKTKVEPSEMRQSISKRNWWIPLIHQLVSN